MFGFFLKLPSTLTLTPSPAFLHLPFFRASKSMLDERCGFLPLYAERTNFSNEKLTLCSEHLHQPHNKQARLPFSITKNSRIVHHCFILVYLTVFVFVQLLRKIVHRHPDMSLLLAGFFYFKVCFFVLCKTFFLLCDEGVNKFRA